MERLLFSANLPNNTPVETSRFILEREASRFKRQLQTCHGFKCVGGISLYSLLLVAVCTRACVLLRMGSHSHAHGAWPLVTARPL